MSSKRHVRRKECGRKAKFPDAESAQRAAVKARIGNAARGDNWWLNVYPCKFCGQYHFGHSTKKRGKR